MNIKEGLKRVYIFAVCIGAAGFWILVTNTHASRSPFRICDVPPKPVVEGERRLRAFGFLDCRIDYVEASVWFVSLLAIAAALWVVGWWLYGWIKRGFETP
ncbi:hypothetical protein [Mesorhizobium muleiense]|uniref:Uncharacterized protein n=1 Tax=Mesorhizobium muleiense TaxID=1004279 RepID=A0A1G8LCY5_9HYPH|nr:hypothetical protein [Mesorhizobium muleiense]MCF6100354.1 hypothetical protein [Mesorhizobium muleiense]SDI53505.1 hypothetical protein SAMN05428953_102208 [Mesorhizobium muleiense]